MQHHHKITMFPIHAPSPQAHHVSHPCTITTRSPRFPSMQHHHKLNTFSIHAPSPQDQTFFPSMHHLHKITTFSLSMHNRVPPQPSCFPASFVPQNIQGRFKFPSILILVHSHK
jgi:hypothetical protein